MRVGPEGGRRGAGGGPVVEEPSEVPSINRQAGVQEEEEEDEEEEQLSCRPTCCNQRRKQPGAPGTVWKSAHAWLMSHSQIREDFLLRRCLQDLHVSASRLLKANLSLRDGSSSVSNCLWCLFRLDRRLVLWRSHDQHRPPAGGTLDFRTEPVLIWASSR